MDFIRSISIKWFPCARFQSPCSFWLFFSSFFGVASFRINIVLNIVVGSMQRRQHQMQYKKKTYNEISLAHPFAHHSQYVFMSCLLHLRYHLVRNRNVKMGMVKRVLFVVVVAVVISLLIYRRHSTAQNFETQFLCSAPIYYYIMQNKNKYTRQQRITVRELRFALLTFYSKILIFSRFDCIINISAMTSSMPNTFRWKWKKKYVKMCDKLEARSIARNLFDQNENPNSTEIVISVCCMTGDHSFLFHFEGWNWKFRKIWAAISRTFGV